MKKIFWSFIRISLVGIIAWFVVSRWFGINAPMFRKGTPTEETLLQRIQLLSGFSISVYADQLPGARMLRMTEIGDLLVSLPRQQKIVLLEKDADGDGLPDARRDLVTGLNLPHGIDIYNDWLYVAETDAIGRIRFNSTTGETYSDYQRIVTGLPSGGNHWTRSLSFGPDGLMYVAVGSSCNVCDEKNSQRAAMLRYPDEGGQGEIFATGLRNTVGFDWHPVSKQLYGVDNGRDFLGDDFPPCELNRIEQGKFYGWPYSNGNQIPDPDFGEGNQEKILNSVPPVHGFGAHTAPLGFTFIRGKDWPEALQGAALVALHGSWNRSEKSGYKVVSLHFDESNAISERLFISGFELNDDVIGRPVDIVEDPEGSIFISDDFTGSIYRVTYNEAKGK